ncbi:unnamed protein product [Peniophora sp. CBMAI 1063]|nr:unnamed protein product [Peniophora sp. CBMAI 1063]
MALFSVFTVHWTLSMLQFGDLLFREWTEVLSLEDGADIDEERVFFLYIDFGPIVLECVSFGVFCTLCAVAIYIYACKDTRTQPHQVMLIAILLMFTISFIHMVFQARVTVDAYGDILEDGVSQHYQPSLGADIAQVALVSANVLLGDAIVLWRMCVLLDQKIWARMIALSLFTSTLSLAIVNLVDEVRQLTGDGALLGLAGLSDLAAGTIVQGLSLATNVISTTFIGWRAWCYRRDIAANLAALSRRSMAEKVMTVLVESGFVYCFVWILFIVDSKTSAINPSAESGLSTHSLTGGARYFNHYVAQITGIYPTLILVIVALEQSYLEQTFTESKLSIFVAAHRSIDDSRTDNITSLSTPGATPRAHGPDAAVRIDTHTGENERFPVRAARWKEDGGENDRKTVA